MRPHQNLVVWQKGMALYVQIYRETKTFPKEELFGLVSQMRRSALSVPSNIAEGSARNSTKEYLQFLSHAAGSLSELDTQIEAAFRVGLLTENNRDTLLQLCEELSSLLGGLQKSLRRKLNP